MLTTDEISYEDMQQAIHQSYKCAVCQNILTVAWYQGQYVLRCGKNINHKGITRHDLKEEELRRKVLSMESTELTKMNETQMTDRIKMAKFPQDMSPKDMKLLAKVAITYGFDPLMGEIMVYQGNPYISIAGRYRKALETGELDGISTRPATKAEKEAREIPDGDYLYHADIWKKGCLHSFEGWGRVRKAEIDKAKASKGREFLPIANDPQGMAEKRAEAKGLKKGFYIPVPLPNIEDIGSEPDEVKAPIVKAAVDVLVPETPPNEEIPTEKPPKPEPQKQDSEQYQIPDLLR